MSLSKLPSDLIAALSQRLEGVELINLMRCGDRRLRRTLQMAEVKIRFIVKHVGFLAIPDVLNSIASNFPRATSLVFVDDELSGCEQLTANVRPTLEDITKMSASKIMVKEFACLGRGAFVDTMCRWLTISPLVFPVAEQWAVGDFNSSYERNHSRASFYGGSLSYFTVPKTATSVAITMNSSGSSNDNSLKDLESTFASPLVSFDSGFFLFDGMFELAGFQSLSVLKIACDIPFSMQQLPRTLITFHVYTERYRCRTQGSSNPICLVNPPPHLETLIVEMGNELIIDDKEILPQYLRTLKLDSFLDPSCKLSAHLLPKSLTNLCVSHVFLEKIATSEKLGIHLFRQVNEGDSSWTLHWPPKLEISFEYMFHEEELIEKLIPHASVPSCNYTLQRILLSTEPLTMDQPLHPIVQPIQVLPCLFANRAASGIPLYGNDLSVLQAVLLEHGEAGPPSRIVNTSIHKIGFLTDPRLGIEQLQRALFVIKNIHKLCISISTLGVIFNSGMFRANDDDETEMTRPETCEFVIPAWVKSLGLSHLPLQPIHYECIDNLETLSIQSMDASLVSSLHLHLPPRLVMLELHLLKEAREVFAESAVEFMSKLPRTLLYLRLKHSCSIAGRGYTGNSVIAGSILEALPSVLPPNLRLLDLSIFNVAANDAVSFAKKVSLIPSLRRLVLMVFHLGSTGHISIVGLTHACHCLELAKRSTIEPTVTYEAAVNDAEDLVDIAQRYRQTSWFFHWLQTAIVATGVAVSAYILKSFF